MFSEVERPAQSVWNGVKAPLETVDGVFRGVRLQAGTHTVELDFRPRLVYLGGAISLLGLLSLTVIWRQGN